MGNHSLGMYIQKMKISSKLILLIAMLSPTAQYISTVVECGLATSHQPAMYIVLLVNFFLQRYICEDLFSFQIVQKNTVVRFRFIVGLVDDKEDRVGRERSVSKRARVEGEPRTQCRGR